MPHLCGRILKPCQWSHFETELTSSLAVIPANLFQPQESDLEKKTPDTSGLTSATSSGQLDLFDVSLKMSKDTLVSDSEKSLATWKALVTKLRGEYSQRVKSAHLIRESESTLWRTPAVSDPGITLDRLKTKDGSPPRSGERLYDKVTGRNAQFGLSQQVKMEPTQWPTPTAHEAEKAGFHPKGQMGQSLSAMAKRGELIWPTPRTSDYKGPVKPETLSLKGRNPMTNSLMDATQHMSGSGQLNPAWVEWLMGVPIGWTALDSWETE